MTSNCKAQGCRAHAWHADLCSYHAYLVVQSKCDAASGDRRDRRAREVRDAAADAGISLDEVDEHVVARSGKKIRSPVS